MKRVTDSKHAVLTPVKVKHRTPETRPNPCLIYLSSSRLKQMCVELMDEHMDEHDGAGSSYEFYAKSRMTLRYNVSKSDQLPGTTVKNAKK